MKSSLVCIIASAFLFCILGLSSAQNEGATQFLSGGVYQTNRAQSHPLDIPYVTLLRLYKEQKVISFCNGARINQHWFVTAAECLNGTKYDKLELIHPTDAVVGRQYSSTGFEFKLLKPKIHPEYNAETKANNIALIYCKSCPPVGLKYFASLPEQNEHTFNVAKVPIISSWSINDRDKTTTVGLINHIRTDFLPPFVCGHLYPKKWDEANNLCVRSTQGYELTEYEVGAPLVISTGPENTEIQLIGIATSRSVPSVESRPTFIFTKLSSYIDWIQEEAAGEA